MRPLDDASPLDQCILDQWVLLHVQGMQWPGAVSTKGASSEGRTFKTFRLGTHCSGTHHHVITMASFRLIYIYGKHSILQKLQQCMDLEEKRKKTSYVRKQEKKHRVSVQSTYRSKVLTNRKGCRKLMYLQAVLIALARVLASHHPGRGSILVHVILGFSSRGWRWLWSSLSIRTLLL